MRWLALLPLLLLLAACQQPPAYQPFQQRIYIFGTLVDITIWGGDAASAQLAFDRLEADFQDAHREWHAWRPGALTSLNESIRAGKPHTAPAGLIPLLTESQHLYRLSDGLFNPAIGGLISLWGFHSDERPNGPPPDQTSIRQWLDAAPTMDHLTIDGELVQSSNRAVQIDLGGFAKGYAIDRAIETLHQMGHRNVIVNAGGDLRASGSKGGRPWRIGVRHPQGEGVLAALEVVGDESIFTSGNYERYNEHLGVRYAHILDPRSGQPVQGITSVTVIHDNGAEADAAATALVVAGVEGWQRVAAQMGIASVMLVEESGMVHLSESMARRVRFTDSSPPLTIRPDPVAVGPLVMRQNGAGLPL